MSKKIILSLVLIICIMGSITNVFAADGLVIKEVPNVKIVMDGVITPYQDVPLNVNSRTMLPLRELLVNLGVPNDNEHIVWNGQEKSVTINKDSTKLYLKVDSKTAYVNDQPMQMDVAPMLYSKNGRVYIPLKFVSDNLGKKVVWDGSSNAVLIRDLAEYNKIKDIFEKSQAAMKDIKKYRMAMDIKEGFISGQNSVNMNINSSGEYDMANKKMHMLMSMNFLGMDIKSDTYYSDNASYTENPFTSTWEKQTLTPEEYDKNFSSESSITMPEGSEALYAGLVAVPGANGDETVLKGDVYLKELFDKAMEESENQSVSPDVAMDFNKFYMEIVIDNKLNLIKSFNMSISGTETIGDEKIFVKMDIGITLSDFDGAFEVTVPQEVLNSAEETSGSEDFEY